MDVITIRLNVLDRARNEPAERTKSKHKLSSIRVRDCGEERSVEVIEEERKFLLSVIFSPFTKYQRRRDSPLYLIHDMYICAHAYVHTNTNINTHTQTRSLGLSLVRHQRFICPLRITKGSPCSIVRAISLCDVRAHVR